MNALSLAYSNAQKQEPIDFGFDGKTTGVKKICTHERNLETYAQELVYKFGTLETDHYELDLYQLPKANQLELARIYIESIDREIEFACYGKDETINSDFLCALLAMLKNNSEETREQFAKITLVNVVNYYKDTLQTALDAACEAYYINEMDSFYLNRSF